MQPAPAPGIPAPGRPPPVVRPPKLPYFPGPRGPGLRPDPYLVGLGIGLLICSQIPQCAENLQGIEEEAGRLGRVIGERMTGGAKPPTPPPTPSCSASGDDTYTTVDGPAPAAGSTAARVTATADAATDDAAARGPSTSCSGSCRPRDACDYRAPGSDGPAKHRLGPDHARWPRCPHSPLRRRRTLDR